MFIKEAHILIEQRLQNIGVFAYSDMTPEEIDLRIKTKVWQILEREFPSNEINQLNKPKVDVYSTLTEKDVELSVIKGDRHSYVNLPENYFHLINASALVIGSNLDEESMCNIPSGKLIEGKYYKVLENKIKYNDIFLPVRTIFRATSTSEYNPSIIGIPSKVIELPVTFSPIRFYREEFINNIEANPLERSRIKSPTATVADKKIIVNHTNFSIEKIYISYLKKPNTPNSKFKTYSSGDTLDLNKKYEVVSGSVIYKGVTYTYSTFNPPSFTTSESQSISGTGKVREFQDGDINLPYSVCLKIIDEVALSLSIDTEQNPRKIEGQLINK